MNAICHKCSMPLTGPNKLTACKRNDCWLDFSPLVRMLEVVARPSPEYLPKVEK